MERFNVKLNRAIPFSITMIFIAVLLFLAHYNNFYYKLSINLYIIIIIFSIFIITLNTPHYEKNDYFPFIGISSLYIGMFYIFNFAAKYDPIIIHNISSKQQLYFNNIFHLMESIAFFASYIFLYKSLRKSILFTVYTIASILALVILFRWDHTILAGQKGFSLFITISEYLAPIFLVIGSIKLFQKRSYMDKEIFKFMFAAMIALAVSAIPVSPLEVLGCETDLSDLIRALSYYFVYKALVQSALREPQKLIFFDLKLMNEELRQKTEELQKSRDFYLNILDRLPNLTWRCERDGSRNFFNEAWLDFTGTFSSDICDYIHKDDYIEYVNGFEAAFKSRVQFESEYRLKRYDGEYIWFRETAIPFYDLDNEFVGYIGSCLDLTVERNKIELLEKYKLLTDNANDIILFVDTKGKIMEANKKAEKVYGYTKEELCSMTLFNLRKVSDKDLVGRQIKMAAEASIIFETVHVAKSGIEIPVEVSSSGVSLAGRDVLLSVIRDITERKKTEQMLQKSELKYRSLFENMQEAFAYAEVIYDDFGKPEDFILKDMNKAFLDMTKKVKENVIDRSIIESFPYINNTTPDIIDVFKTVVTNKDKKTVEVIFHDVNQWQYVSCFSMTGFHIYIMLLNITEAKHMQKELNDRNIELGELIENLKSTQVKLIQNEKMAGIGQLSAGIAHEINNPLGFVSSNVETLNKYIDRYGKVFEAYECLEQDINGKTYEEIVDCLNEINDIKEKYNLELIHEDVGDLIKDTIEGLSRISKIVMALKAFARSENNTEFSQYDLNEGLRTTLVIANNEIKYCADIKVDYGDIPIIEANSGQINQVILNILMNSVHAIRFKKPDIRGLINITTRSDEKYVYCEIEDNGIGIPKSIINRIIDPFFTTKPVGEGTGLGLSISYDIVVKKHNGDLIFESAEGVGTKTNIKLPISQ